MVRDKAAAHRRNASGRPGSSPHRARTSTPIRRNVSPLGRSGSSPRRQGSQSRGRSYSPSRTPVASSRRSRSPSKSHGSPRRPSPSRAPGSTARTTGSPRRRKHSPSKRRLVSSRGTSPPAYRPGYRHSLGKLCDCIHSSDNPILLFLYCLCITTVIVVSEVCRRNVYFRLPRCHAVTMLQKSFDKSF